jgi:hypothetical protein
MTEMNWSVRHFRPGMTLAGTGFRNNWGFGIGGFGRPEAVNRWVDIRLGGQFSMDFSASDKFAAQVTYPYVMDGHLRVAAVQYGLHGVAELRTTDRFPVQFFVQGLAGSRVLAHSQTFTPERDHDEDLPCPEPDLLSAGAVFSYGVGAGLGINLGTYTRLDLMGQYLAGTGTRIVDMRTVDLNKGNGENLTYEIRRPAQTSGWLLGAGLTFRISEGSSCGSSGGRSGCSSYDDNNNNNNNYSSGCHR